jgi:hypothetical protein
MNDANLHRWLADAILLSHFLIVSYVVGGLLCVLIGRWSGWRWIYNRTFRWSHLLVIAFIAVQAWLGQLCPLTIWEQNMRVRAGQPFYNESFVQHWLHQLMFYSAPLWVFAAIYSTIALVVVWLWMLDRDKSAD